MKRKILTFATLVSFMLVFASCSNSEVKECSSDNAEIAKSVETKRPGSMTEEEVKERLRILNEKYNLDFKMVKPAELHDELNFAVLENVMRRTVGLEPLYDTNYLDSLYNAIYVNKQ